MTLRWTESLPLQALLSLDERWSRNHHLRPDAQLPDGRSYVRWNTPKASKGRLTLGSFSASYLGNRGSSWTTAHTGSSLRRWVNVWLLAFHATLCYCRLNEHWQYSPKSKPFCNADHGTKMYLHVWEPHAFAYAEVLMNKNFCNIFVIIS